MDFKFEDFLDICIPQIKLQFAEVYKTRYQLRAFYMHYVTATEDTNHLRECGNAGTLQKNLISPK